MEEDDDVGISPLTFADQAAINSLLFGVTRYAAARFVECEKLYNWWRQSRAIIISGRRFAFLVAITQQLNTVASEREREREFGKLLWTRAAGCGGWEASSRQPRKDVRFPVSGDDDVVASVSQSVGQTVGLSEGCLLLWL